MAGQDTQPLVTGSRLDLSMIAPRERVLVLECGVPREPREFRIRGRLDTDRMVDFLQLETQINEALQPGKPVGLLVEALETGNRAIRDLLLELNEQVPERLHLDEQQTLMTLAWISGDVTVADAIARVLTGGIEGALAPEELDDAERAAVESGAPSVGSDAPLP